MSSTPRPATVVLYRKDADYTKAGAGLDYNEGEMRSRLFEGDDGGVYAKGFAAGIKAGGGDIIAIVEGLCTKL